MQEVRLGGREFPLPALLSDVFYIGNYFYIMRCCVCCCLPYYLAQWWPQLVETWPFSIFGCAFFVISNSETSFATALEERIVGFDDYGFGWYVV